MSPVDAFVSQLGSPCVESVGPAPIGTPAKPGWTRFDKNQLTVQACRKLGEVF